MAADHILINTAAAGGKGAELYNIMTQAESVLAGLRGARDNMDQMINGGDYSMLETKFGIPTGQGPAAYNLVVGALAQIDTGSTAYKQMLARLG